MDREIAKQEVAKLVQIFKDNINQYKLSTYKEAQVRKEFIDKFFRLLDWDIDNTAGNSEQFKEVVNEDAIKISGNTKAPDYSFRVGGQRIFFVEAKKPSVNLKDNPEFAYQLRRYAWNTGIPISILTDFEEFAVYDCRVKPNEKDDSNVARIMIIPYTDYVANFDKICDIFSKEAVLKGSFNRFVESKKGSKGTEDNFFIDGVCPTTRFMIASEYSRSRTKKKITSIIGFAKERTTNKIQMVTTDGLNAYIGAVKKVFGYSLKEGKQSVFHNRVVTSNEDTFNYPIERLHNNVRARTKVFRGFHGSLRSANLILKGYEIYYNFIRINQAINKRPYELATDLKLKENNKWLELIKLAKQ